MEALGSVLLESRRGVGEVEGCPVRDAVVVANVADAVDLVCEAGVVGGEGVVLVLAFGDDDCVEERAVGAEA